MSVCIQHSDTFDELLYIICISNTIQYTIMSVRYIYTFFFTRPIPLIKLVHVVLLIVMFNVMKINDYICDHICINQAYGTFYEF